MFRHGIYQFIPAVSNPDWLVLALSLIASLTVLAALLQSHTGDVARTTHEQPPAAKIVLIAPRA
jgi:hypothetical protein